MRSVLAIIAGYAIFAVSAGLWFQLSGQPAHGEAALAFKLSTLLYGSFFSLLAGFVTQAIAKGKTVKVNIALAIVIFLLALTSMLLSSGSHWTQLMTLIVFAPLALVSGYATRKL